MPATFVLRGVRSPRTKASSVTCSTLPPSHAFQFRVSVTTTATASITTNNGVAYFNHPHCGLVFGGTGSGCVVGVGVGAGALAAAIVTTPSVRRKGAYFCILRTTTTTAGKRRLQPKAQDDCSARVLQQIGLQSHSVDLATTVDYRVKALPVIKKRFHARRGTLSGDSTGSVRPGKQRPSSWRTLTKERKFEYQP